MRLTESEKTAILSEILKRDPQAKVFLYGSRVQDHLKGGDIDLLVITNTLKLSEKINILIGIKEKIGQQKIDLTLKTEAEIKTDAFFTEMKKTSIELK